MLLTLLILLFLSYNTIGSLQYLLVVQHMLQRLLMLLSIPRSTIGSLHTYSSRHALKAIDATIPVS